ncbi:phage tail fiber protein, partial [Providencia rustigianii]
WGGLGLDRGFSEKEIVDYFMSRNTVSQIFRYSNAGTFAVGFRYAPIMYSKVANTWNAVTADIFGAGVRISSGDDTRIVTYNIWTDKNTTVDSQGNIKKASPVIKVFTDHIEPNDESEGITLEKLGTGRYKLKGTLGMNSDASWGGYNGGIVIPKGINGLELVWADYKVLSDGDIIIETNYRKHADLPPPILLKRLTTYPEFMDDQGNELESYAPCDIPAGHWIDVRVNMPSDSIYNQKLAEAERLAKIEAEKFEHKEVEEL